MGFSRCSMGMDFLGAWDLARCIMAAWTLIRFRPWG